MPDSHPVAIREPGNTTHYSVVDAEGNAVAVTTTLNDSFGSRATAEGLGFLLNDEMDDFASKQGVPNAYGLIQGPANAIGPNKRPLSAMTPTIVLKDGKLFLVLGSPGGPTIITTVANILMGVVDFGLDIQEAVNAPRFHHQWLPDQIAGRRPPLSRYNESSTIERTQTGRPALLGRRRVHHGRPQDRRAPGRQRRTQQWEGGRLLMLKAVSTYVYVKERLHPGLLDELVKSGAQAIEIFAARQHFDYANRKQHVREIAEWFRPPAFRSTPCTRPCTPITSGDAPAPRRSISHPPIGLAASRPWTRSSARSKSPNYIPFRFLVQHIGNPDEEFDDKKFEAAMTSVEHLRAFAKPLGVRVLVENIPNELSTPDRLVEFIHTMHFDDIGVCFDCGHAHMMAGIPESFEILKTHICSTHVHDNHKDKDSHLWPGKGSIDWKQTMELLRTAPQTPPLLLEVEGEDKKNSGEDISATFRKLEDS